jgi:Icc-related predicted phosphoesterase
LPHTGFKVFLSFLRLFKPRYHLHGHIHIYRQDEVTQTQFEETTIVNVYPYRGVGDVVVTTQVSDHNWHRLDTLFSNRG